LPIAVTQDKGFVPRRFYRACTQIDSEAYLFIKCRGRRLSTAARFFASAAFSRVGLQLAISDHP
jgi:hypothetical protein